MVWRRGLPTLADDACRVFLCRHARTRLNELGCVQGLIDEPIDEMGRAQAARLGAALAEVPVDVVVTSTLTRTIATAQYLPCGEGREVKRVADARLNEMAFGSIDGTPLDAPHTRAVVAELHDAWRGGQSDVAFPGGESYAMVSARCRAALHEVLLEHTPRHVVVVSHGRLLSVLLSDIAGTGPPGVFDRQLVNCGIAAVDARVVDGGVEYTTVATHVDEHLSSDERSSGFHAGGRGT